ncbi:MAG TPA: ammonia-dependent NAD(+) synthetase [Lactobacillaceae bacterium]|jgi:NAD+ synthase
MQPLQSEIIAALQVQPVIDPAAEIQRSVTFLQEFLRANLQYKSLVLAVSGGQDSTLVGRLARLAIDGMADDDYRLIAIRQPYGVQQDEGDAQQALDFIQPDLVVETNIQAATDAMTASLRAAGLTVDDMSRGSIKPKMRMIAQYAVAREHAGVVLGTDHASEAFAGFFTKYGDGGTDVNPIWRLNKRQGRALLVELGAPANLYEKTPTADLEDDRPQLADEVALGLTYDQIDDYLEGKEVSTVVAEKIAQHYLTSEHKRHLPATIYDSWWR